MGQCFSGGSRNRDDPRPPSDSAANPTAFRPPPPPQVTSAKSIKNDVNVHKDTIKICTDAADSHSSLVSFTFDALLDGRITILYFAKEEEDCTFTPVYSNYCVPMMIPFQKGLGQKFVQPSGSGIDLGFFLVDELSNLSLAQDIFPLVICVETCLATSPGVVETAQPPPTTTRHAQITQAALEKSTEGNFQVRVIKQILWSDGVRYELRELYGIGHTEDVGFNESDPGKECVICMTQPMDIAVLPCRHMCMCSGCARELRARSNKCPICRELIQELIEINGAAKAST